jgi:hypothetical protein
LRALQTQKKPRDNRQGAKAPRKDKGFRLCGLVFPWRLGALAVISVFSADF